MVRNSGNIPPRLSVLIVSSHPQFGNEVRSALEEEELIQAQVNFVGHRSEIAGRSMGRQHLVIVDTGAEDACWLAGRLPDAAVILIARPEDVLLKGSLHASGVIDLPSSPRSSGGHLSPFIGRMICYHALRQQNMLLTKAIADSSIAKPLPMYGHSTPFDPRTGWHTHAHIIDRCQEEIVRATRYSLPIALTMVELEGYEEIEQSYGNEFVNEWMTLLAQRLRAVCRHCDVVGHYGPGSFLVILTNTDDVGGKRFCERINQALLPSISVNQQTIDLVWSTALVSRPEGHPTTPTELLNQLERKMERARRAGKRGVVVND